MKAVNLLPQDLRAADRRPAGAAGPRSGPRVAAGPLAILGVLALVLVAVVATVFTQNRIKSGERDLRTVQAEQLVVQREVNALASYGTFRDLAARRVSTVRQLAAARFDWERTLRDLSRAIPQDVTLELISGTVAPNTNSAGASPNPLRASIPAPAIELSGCTVGQLQVARLMARLRAVQGVTRVSLSSSQAEDGPSVIAPGGTTAPQAGTDERKGCGEDAPHPKFEIVIFFEKAGAPAAGNAPAPGAGTPTAATPATPATPAATPAPGAAATPAPAQPAATPTPGAAAQTSTDSPSATKEVSAP